MYGHLFTDPSINSYDQWHGTPRTIHANGATGHFLLPLRIEEIDAGNVMGALHFANRFRPGAQVTVLHVLKQLLDYSQPSYNWMDAIDRLHGVNNRAPLQLSLETTRRHITTRIDSIVPAKLRDNLILRVDCRLGDPAKEIAMYAQAHGVDMIVLCKGHSRWKWPFRPRVTNDIMRHCETPVMVLRPSTQTPGAPGLA